MTTNRLCIYHGGCLDGQGAAYAVWKKHPNTLFAEGKYGEGAPDCRGKEVIIVDFSYKQEEMRQIAEQAESVTVIDHHKTAEADLLPLLESGVIKGIFDMGKSGAVLAWEYFHDDPPPALLQHIQDRDLWRFDMPWTREIVAAVASYEFGFETFDLLAQSDPMRLRDEGVAIQRSYWKNIKDIIKATERRFSLAGYSNIPLANVPHFMASDVGNLLAEKNPFSATYYDSNGFRNYSLRSIAGGADVSEIAKQFGGGGHKHAAGFRVPILD